MQITVTRTGGFAGVHQQLGPVEISTLDPEVADRIHQIVAELDFFTLPERLPSDGDMRDGYFYAVEVVADGRDHTVRTEDGSHDPAALELHRLIRFLDEAGGQFEDGPMDSSDGVRTRDWSAWYNRMPLAEDPNLHVSGTCRLESSGITVRLEPDNEGIVDDPALVVLRLVVTTPAIHDAQYVEREVTWQDDVGAGIERVRITGISTEIPVTIVE